MGEKDIKMYLLWGGEVDIVFPVCFLFAGSNFCRTVKYSCLKGPWQQRPGLSACIMASQSPSLLPSRVDRAFSSSRDAARISSCHNHGCDIGSF